MDGKTKNSTNTKKRELETEETQRKARELYQKRKATRFITEMIVEHLKKKHKIETKKRKEEEE